MSIEGNAGIERAQFATVHRIRFAEIRTPEMLELTLAPEGALSWKIGPSGEVGPDGYRLPAAVWCALGLYRSAAAAEAALQSRLQFMPFLAEAVEAWHGLLLPVMHRGACNHLERGRPEMVFDACAQDPGGICMVVTTAGFEFGPGLKIERVIDFRRNVDLANAWMGKAEGCLASQVFTPHTVGDDGVTLSIWRNDAAMLAAAYRPGGHRAQLDRHNAEPMMDRSSFTRCRILASHGAWDGRDLAQALS